MEEEIGNEEILIDESELDGLLEETTKETKEVETEKEEVEEPEIELEPETQGEVETEKEEEGIELELEEKETPQKETTEPEIVSAYKPEQSYSTPEQSLISQTGLVAPVCTIQQSVQIFKEFERAKKEILSSRDILWIGSDGRPSIPGQGSPHIKRPGWRKLARFFGLSWDILKIEKFPMDGGGYMYKTKVKVWHPAGASVVSEGVATSKDAFFTKGGRKEADEENVIMKSQTVAVNRGIDDILGGGEVSAEEVE